MLIKYTEKIKSIFLNEVYYIYADMDENGCTYSLRKRNTLNSSFTESFLEKYIFNLPQSIDIRLYSDCRNRLSRPYHFLNKLFENCRLNDIERIEDILSDKNFLIEVHYPRYITGDLTGTRTPDLLRDRQAF